MEAATVEIRRSRGDLVVTATGRTGKGQRYVKGVEVIKAQSTSDPNFKSELSAAVNKLFEREA
jgi:hypothetical protein